MWLPSGSELRLLAPELVLVGTIVAVLLVPIFAGRNAYLAALVALTGTVAGLFATGAIAGDVAEAAAGGLAPPASPPMFIADRFTLFFRLLLFMFLMLIIWLWLVGITQSSRAAGLGRTDLARAEAPGTESSNGGPEFLVLLLTSALGMMLMVSTLNLLVLVVAMETASLPSYAIVASDRRSRLGAEAALKYVIFGAAAAAIMVYGISLLYGGFGALDLGVIAQAVARNGAAASPLFWLGLAGLGAGIAFKIAAVPMHLWCPDVFEGAPIEITTWLSVASKAAGLGVLLRVVDTLTGAASATAPLTWCIGAVAAVTCTVGNLAALRQESVKRILAYSSIAHAGYMMMAAAIFLAPDIGPNRGVAAVVAYLLVYVVMNLGAFGATALVVWQTGRDHLSAFTGLGRRAPWLALPLAVCLFSLVGLPPLGGFAAKWFLLVALGRAAGVHPWLWGLVIIAVINTAISLYYYVRIVRQMYLTDDPALPALRPPLGGLAVVNLCAVVLLLLGTLWFSPLGRRADAMAIGLFRGANAGWVASPHCPAATHATQAAQR
jgi:NADH-quinone oxidoreductase subunit N